ncbi:hypothetical protein [Janthinobacterium sp. 75]|jgi:hypothetical protein|uniref:hypothetical protein n=1 Tax=Janthinobacterium sp. 75 TaxID=2135628 RepID=UPI0010637B35|nr:hypothetical protein [Janthinobacterium sp. 75]TDY34928.1 hypothetical protein C8C89_2763 [Janthinobacterium sp. 75]
MIAFSLGFILTSLLAVPSLAAADAEPIGAAASLYLFGVLMLGVCIAAFGALARRVDVAHGHWLSSCAGALCGAVLYGSFALAFATPSITASIAYAASALCAASAALLLPGLLKRVARLMTRPGQ